MTSLLLHAISYMLLLFVKSCDLRPHLKMIEYFLLVKDVIVVALLLQKLLLIARLH